MAKLTMKEKELLNRIKLIKQELNTWKKACELACKWFKQTGFIGDQTEVDYYCQQAKKEKDENKN